MSPHTPTDRMFKSTHSGLNGSLRKDWLSPPIKVLAQTLDISRLRVVFELVYTNSPATS